MNGNFEQIIDSFCFEANQNNYEFLLEADVSGWLFYQLVKNNGFNTYQIHLDTRVGSEKLRCDLAIGEINYNDGKRPFVEAQLIAEIKLLPRKGFNDSQHRVHLIHIFNDDLPKLAVFADGSRLLYQIVVDGAGYLNGVYQKQNRLQFLINTRNRIVLNAKLIIVKLEESIWKYEVY